VVVPVTDPNAVYIAAMRQLVLAWDAYYASPSILHHQQLRHAKETQEQLVMLADSKPKLVAEPCLEPE
jgi:hypothetical protein